MSSLIVSVDFPPHKDGISRIAGELASRLSREGEKVVVIGPQCRGAREYDSRHGYIAFRTPLYNWGYLRFIPVMLCMPYVMWKHKVKKVFAMNVAYGGVLSYVLSGYFDFSYILFAYGYEFCKYQNNSLMRKLLLKIYSGAERIVAISDFVKERLFQFGIDSKKIEVIKPCAQLDRFKPVPVRNKRKTLLSVSRLVERKGHDMVLRALPDVKKRIPDILYLIVGVGPMEKPLKKLCKELQLQDNIKFMGKVADEELLRLYNRCDAFIMVSRDIKEKGHVEGFGIVYLEANACGKPVIGGRTGGVAEAIVEGETGLLVDPLSVEEISSAVLKLLEDKAYAEKLGRNGLDRVCRELNWERFFEELNRICV